MVKESSAGDGDVVRLAHVVELEKLELPNFHKFSS